MDQRTKNRLREHTGQPDHRLSKADAAPTPLQPDQTLWSCECGWIGWLSNEATEIILGRPCSDE